MDSLNSIGPWVALGSGILLTMLVSVIRVGTKRPAQIFAILTLAVTMILSFRNISGPAETLFNGCMEVSSLTLCALGLLSALGILFILGTSRYLTKEGIHISDYYHLLLILIFGASVLISSS